MDTFKPKLSSSSPHFLSFPSPLRQKSSLPFSLEAATASKGEVRDSSIVVVILEELELGTRRVVELGGRGRDL